MHSYTVRDLRERTGSLIHGAEAGELAIVTKHGRPVFVAVPVDRKLIENGVHIAIAIDLFKEGIVTLVKAAKIAGMPVSLFMQKLASLKISAVDYEPGDIAGEIDEIEKK